MLTCHEHWLAGCGLRLLSAFRPHGPPGQRRSQLAGPIWGTTLPGEVHLAILSPHAPIVAEPGPGNHVRHLVNLSPVLNEHTRVRPVKLRPPPRGQFSCAADILYRGCSWSGVGNLRRLLATAPASIAPKSLNHRQAGFEGRGAGHTTRTSWEVG